MLNKEIQYSPQAQVAENITSGFRKSEIFRAAAPTPKVLNFLESSKPHAGTFLSGENPPWDQM